MTAVAAMLVLGAACWMLRVLFIVVVPAERLPQRVADALPHLAPAVLAALVAVEVRDLTRGDGAGATAYVVATVALVALVARRTGSIPLAVGIALGAALLLDLVLVG